MAKRPWLQVWVWVFGSCSYHLDYYYSQNLLWYNRSVTCGLHFGHKCVLSHLIEKFKQIQDFPDKFQFYFPVCSPSMSTKAKSSCCKQYWLFFNSSWHQYTESDLVTSRCLATEGNAICSLSKGASSSLALLLQWCTPDHWELCDIQYSCQVVVEMETTYYLTDLPKAQQFYGAECQILCDNITKSKITSWRAVGGYIVVDYWHTMLSIPNWINEFCCLVRCLGHFCKWISKNKRLLSKSLEACRCSTIAPQAR